MHFDCAQLQQQQQQLGVSSLIPLEGLTAVICIHAMNHVHLLKRACSVRLSIEMPKWRLHEREALQHVCGPLKHTDGFNLHSAV